MIPRIERLRASLKRRGIDSFVLLNPANISYLTGFSVQDSYLLVNKAEAVLITDSRYSTEYRNHLTNSKIEVFESNEKLPQILKQTGKRIDIANLAFEQDFLCFSLYQKLKPIFGKKLIPTTEIIENMRLLKDNGEVDLIKKAVSITLDTFKHIKHILKPGVREIELAAEIERYIRLKGATNSSFDIIVASGPNSSLPHAKKTNRMIRKNEPFLIDMGVEYKGYKSDLTRVFFLGKMNSLFKRAYNTVQTAQQKAKKLIRPGIPIEYIDRVARDFIAKKGFKNCFKHSLGHGVGLEIHELPKIAPKNKKKLKAGMVFTLEPAIYLDNKFGVRIEDMVLVTSNGAEVLSGSGN
ncbi:M24 family metallopeptidase [Candidatus Omnitrophota bacterium]